MTSARRTVLTALVCGLALLGATGAAADPGGRLSEWAWPEELRSDEAWEATPRTEIAARTLLRHSDLANGVFWLGGLAAASFGGDPPSDPRWKGGILFDDDLRDALRAGSAGDRELADDFSTGFELATLFAPLVLDAAVRTGWYNDDPVAAGFQAERWLEASALTLFATELTKIVVGRERPFGNACDDTPPRDADCNDDDRRKSFFSGHASLAGVGAGMLCANGLKHEVWGPGAYGMISCGLGIATAATTGILRIVADKHWTTDVIVGWTVGGLVGYYDVPGPFDLLSFTIDGPTGTPVARGTVLPSVGHNSLGLRLAMQF